MKTKRYFLFVLLAVVALALSATIAGAQDAKIIKIASQSPLSGGQSLAGTSMRNTVELAIADLKQPLVDMGFDIHSLIQVHKVIFMVRSLNIEYFKPALLDDLLHITTQAAEIGRSRITLSQHVLRGGVTLVSATVHAVCVGAGSLKPVSVPAPLRHKLGKFS